MASHTPWMWSSTWGQRYFVDPRSNEYVFETGQRVRRESEQPPPQPSIPLEPETRRPRAYGPDVDSFMASQQPLRRPASTRQLGRQSRNEYGSSSDLSSSFVGLSISEIFGRSPQTAPVTANVVSRGQAITDAMNETTMVHTRTQTSPADEISDDTLLKAGIPAHRMPLATAGDTEQLFSEYRKKRRPQKFFVFGRVFKLLWVEPVGGNTTTVSIIPRSTITGRFNQLVYSKVRTFVVIRAGANYCSALPVSTYTGKGVAKYGVKRSEHAIIYSGRESPKPLAQEVEPRPGDDGLRPLAIRVDLDKIEDKLDQMSRLDFGKVHTIEHNIHVCPLGMVSEESRISLMIQFDLVWRKERDTPLQIPELMGHREEPSREPVRSRTQSNESRLRTSQPRDLSNAPTERSSTASRFHDSSSRDTTRIMGQARKMLMERGWTEEDAEEIIQTKLQELARRGSKKVSKGSSVLPLETS